MQLGRLRGLPTAHGARQAADRYRAEGAGPTAPVCLDEVAAQLGVRVRTVELPPDIYGCTAGGVILLSEGLAPEWRRFILAHELGHALIQSNAVSVDAIEEEWWCDWFAIELVMPRASATEGDINEVAHAYGVSPLVTLAQRLRVTQQRRAAVVADSGIACGSCGVRAHVPGCPCGSRRDGASVAWNMSQRSAA